MSELSVSGIGYEGRDLDSFLDAVEASGTDRIVDVRLNAISRKKGFSKRALSEGLASRGIAYSHFPELGNARDNRAGYSETAGPSADLARDAFRARLDSSHAQGRISEILDFARSESVMLFCFEASQQNCHREQVLDAVWNAHIQGLTRSAI